MKRIFSLLLCLFLLFGGGSAMAAEDIQLVASFYPVYIFSQNILQNVPGVSLSCMTAPSTGCLHDYQMLAGDMLKLSKADAFIINGAGMEPFLPSIQEQLPELCVVDSSLGIDLLCENGEHHHDHGHEHSHEEAFNAHIWLAPKNAIQMVENISSQLSAILPMHKEKITQNAAAYIARLHALDETLTDMLSPYSGQSIVTFHDSFPYFAKAYELNIVAVVSMEPNEPLSPQMLKNAIHTVEHAGNPPLFAEPQYRNATLEVISRETGAPVYLLDPMATGDGSITAYEDTLMYNAQILVQAFGTP